MTIFTILCVYVAIGLGAVVFIDPFKSDKARKIQNAILGIEFVLGVILMFVITIFYKQIF